MKTIVVNKGKAHLAEVPDPKLSQSDAKRVLVKVRYSAISSGTELGLIHDSRTPDGFQLGYSVSGEIIEVGHQVQGLKKGDLVACYGGPYVYHAEYLSVPTQLCVKLPSDTYLRVAACVGLGAVAIHSVRRMNLQFGETVWVVGLGFLGMMIAQLCNTNNYQVFATDRNIERCELAKSCGIVNTYLADGPEDLNDRMDTITSGYGFDCIALCAHSGDPRIIDSSVGKLALCGKIAIVGNVPMEFSRELFFQKEAELIIARAAGPGRYDRQYEDEGIDYPRPFVKWTEGRNMQEFIRQVVAGKLNLHRCITHEFSINDAESAYSVLMQEKSSALGVLLRYD